jgi:octaheme c-type cytochrome (tetrathionate reductase family)
MESTGSRWILGLLTIIALISVPIWWTTRPEPAVVDTPWDGVPQRPEHVDHSLLYEGSFASGPEVTAACLECHEDAADQVAHTTHWTWEAKPAPLAGRDELVATGKRNLVNNFCIGIQGNWDSCTACHAGYGWGNDGFDFTDTANVDCLVCHDQSGTYVKGKRGLPAEGVDLLAAAQSVGVPSRENCGSCHFRGGGGNAVKHGDLDESLYYPTASLDVHMGRFDFLCVDCHVTENHEIGGRSMTVSIDTEGQIACRDCHDARLHADARINAHTDTVACQTCHIPTVARREATKTHWDWSTAGDETREEDPHEYLKIKGSFVYQKDLLPEYHWYNGYNDRYLLGDPVDAQGVTVLNRPAGGIDDPEARIWPFKVHRARQPFDTEHGHLLQPQTVGPTGYWTNFDWDDALRRGAALAGLEYSGAFDFAATEMYWPQTHMVAPKEQALQCRACHAEDSRMNWEALGFAGDPMRWGSLDRARPDPEAAPEPVTDSAATVTRDTGPVASAARPSAGSSAGGEE